MFVNEVDLHEEPEGIQESHGRTWAFGDTGENTTKIIMQKMHSCLKFVLPIELWERSTNIGGRNNMLLKNSTDPESCQTLKKLSGSEGSITMLALFVAKSERIAAIALPRKEVADIGVKFFARFIDKRVSRGS